ncbi:conserved hypothetical protein [Xanthomonas oryzae pv. oryzae KACC 10331]|uniref:Calcineurin-like phosphoesterase C-terminal domain-containing protein n=1 Tax=Xanthomonas oryzae pv. oryzae (strain KACC10331 / KXO85) TaxID=291331 RepID=Q5H0Y3_XANOR|nr:conserved hypothetical protein [Xanthomonas oryzae pv. oryzae KACC 10331]
MAHGADEGWQGARPLHEYNVGAACGAFWSGAKDADGIPDATMSDGTPTGYAVLQVAPSGDYTLAYHAARAADDVQLLLHAPKVLRKGAYAAWGIYANVFMGQDDTVVEIAHRQRRLAADEAGRARRSTRAGRKCARRCGRRTARLRPLAGGHAVHASLARRIADRAGSGRAYRRGARDPADRAIQRQHRVSPANRYAVRQLTMTVPKSPSPTRRRCSEGEDEGARNA